MTLNKARDMLMFSFTLYCILISCITRKFTFNRRKNLLDGVECFVFFVFFFKSLYRKLARKFITNQFMLSNEARFRRLWLTAFSTPLSSFNENALRFFRNRSCCTWYNYACLCDKFGLLAGSKVCG